MATMALIEGHKDSTDRTIDEVYEMARNSLMEVARLTEEHDIFMEEHERLKQYVYTYVSYLPARFTPKEKEEKKENVKTEND